MWLVVGGAVVVFATVLYVPLFRDLFRFSQLHAADLIICTMAAGLSVLWFDALKVFGRGRLNLGVR